MAPPGWQKTFGPLRDDFNAEHGWNRVYGRRSKHRRESVRRTPRTLRAPRQPLTLPLRSGEGWLRPPSNPQLLAPWPEQRAGRGRRPRTPSPVRSSLSAELVMVAPHDASGP